MREVSCAETSCVLDVGRMGGVLIEPRTAVGHGAAVGLATAAAQRGSSSYGTLIREKE